MEPPKKRRRVSSHPLLRSTCLEVTPLYDDVLSVVFSFLRLPGFGVLETDDPFLKHMDAKVYDLWFVYCTPTRGFKPHIYEERTISRRHPLFKTKIPRELRDSKLGSVLFQFHVQQHFFCRSEQRGDTIFFYFDKDRVFEELVSVYNHIRRFGSEFIRKTRFYQKLRLEIDYLRRSAKGWNQVDDEALEKLFVHFLCLLETGTAKKFHV